MQTDYIRLVKEIGKEANESVSHFSSLLDSHIVLFQEEIAEQKSFLQKSFLQSFLIIGSILLAGGFFSAALGYLLIEEQVLTRFSHVCALLGALWFITALFFFWRCRSNSSQISLFPTQTYTSLKESISCLKKELR